MILDIRENLLLDSESIDVYKPIQPLSISKKFIESSVPACGLLQSIILFSNMLKYSYLRLTFFLLGQKLSKFESINNVVLLLLKFGNFMMNEIVHHIELSAVFLNPFSQDSISK